MYIVRLLSKVYMYREPVDDVNDPIVFELGNFQNYLSGNKFSENQEFMD